MKFNVGDKVKVVNAGLAYSFFDDFITKVMPNKKRLWKNGDNVKHNGIYTVLESAVHISRSSEGVLCIIENLEKTQVFVIGESGLELVEPALPRICYILGGEDTPLEIGEEFIIEGECSEIYRISECGERQARRSDGTWYKVLRERELANIINHPERIIRKPRITVTDKEKGLLNWYTTAGCLWAARDDNGELYVYVDKPEKGGTVFNSMRYNYYRLPDSVLPSITFENSPIYIPDYVEVAE